MPQESSLGGNDGCEFIASRLVIGVEYRRGLPSLSVFLDWGRNQSTPYLRRHGHQKYTWVNAQSTWPRLFYLSERTIGRQPIAGMPSCAKRIL
jgi:hypothetical protein